MNKSLNAVLYAPPSYIAASDAERARLCNGCGPQGWKGALVPETLWGLPVSSACHIHDWMYAEGLDDADKQAADRVLLHNMLRLIAAEGGWRVLQWLRRRRAHTYYRAVRDFGGPYFWHGKNPPDSLIAAWAAA